MSVSRLASIFRNSAFLGLATVLDRGGEYLLVLYIARALGVEFFGDYVLVLALYSIFQKLGIFGLKQLVMREMARDTATIGAKLANYTLFGAGLAVGLTVAQYVSINLLSYQGSVLTAMYVAGVALVPGILRGIAEAAISAVERMEYITVFSLVGNVLRVSTSIVLLSKGAALPSIFWMLALSEAFLCGLYALVIHRRFGKIEWRVDLAEFRALLPAVGRFFLMSIFLVGANHIDAVMLSKLADQRAVGLYGAAFKLVQAIILFRPALLQALFPSMSTLSVSAPAKFQQLTEASIRLFVAILLPVAMVVTLWADRLMPWLYGENFQGAALTLQAMVWVIVPSYVYATLTRTLVASNREQQTIVVAAVAMVSNVVLDIVLIPVLGAAGAAIASLITMTLACVLAVWCVVRYAFAFDFKGILLKPLVLTLFVGILVYTLLPATPLVKTSIWLILYIAILFATGLLTARMLVQGRQLLQHLLRSIGSSRA